MTDKLEILTKLRMAKVSSCSCLTKTPEASYHREDCLYRVLAEAIEFIAAPPELAELQATIDRLTAENERLKGGQGEPVAIPDECPHLIMFDDTDRENLLFSGAGARSAALKTWEKISMSWNAHLFVRVERNSRDDRYPSATVSTSQPAPVSVADKYDDVLIPFLAMMRAELHANAGKGDRPGWLAMDRKTALLEIFYHLGKLQKAVKNGDQPGIGEYAADVANMSMMLADVCDCLDKVKELNQ